MKVALIHDWLVTYAGAERVLEQLLLLYPCADLFAVCDFLPENDRDFLHGRRPKTTFIQKLPGARRRYRTYLPLMPLAIEQLDVSHYDVIISSSHAVAKGILTGPDQLHISYVHTPIRYAWDLQHQYLRESGLEKGVKSWLARWILHRARMWDVRTANGVDHFIANSSYIRRRVAKAYRRVSDVVYPPVDVGRFTAVRDKRDYYLTASRLVPYKRVDLVVEAFAQMPDKRLVVIGDGPEREKIENLSRNKTNIELLGYQSNEELSRHMSGARAFIFAAEEDFGIAPVEAQACGTPVIAYGKGGALETVQAHGKGGATGLFFDDQTAQAIRDAVERFEGLAAPISAEDCRMNAEKFSNERFQRQFCAIVDRHWEALQESKKSLA